MNQVSNTVVVQETGAVGALSALAHVHRLRVFRALVVAGDEGVSAGALAAMLGMPASSMSFHLKELSRADLVHTEADGRFVIYRANYSQMTGLIGYLTEHCCATSPSAVCCPPSISSQGASR
jgi:ArsR family transcriptional regulator, arsenate/arsenite/antimonite-responsive transcriptional repressor